MLVIEQVCKRGLLQHKNMKFPRCIPPSARTLCLPKWRVCNLKLVDCGLKTVHEKSATYE